MRPSCTYHRMNSEAVTIWRQTVFCLLVAWQKYSHEQGGNSSLLTFKATSIVTYIWRQSITTTFLFVNNSVAGMKGRACLAIQSRFRLLRWSRYLWDEWSQTWGNVLVTWISVWYISLPPISLPIATFHQRPAAVSVHTRPQINVTIKSLVRGYSWIKQHRGNRESDKREREKLTTH
jgi:hypothetical protein